MVENTQENREKMAAEVVEGMDMDGLIEYATSQLANYYSRIDNKDFNDLWEEMMEDD